MVIATPYWNHVIMGGVDKSDQLIHYYNVLRQTRKYWKTLFFHFIDVACVNAYIMHKELEKKPLSHYKFREKLARSLSNTTYIPSFDDSQGEEDSSTDESGSDLLLSEHHITTLDKRSHCVYCKVANNEMHYTTRQCAKCKAPLCFWDRDCFVKWHDCGFLESRKQWKKSSLQVQPRVGRPLGSQVTKGKGKRKKRKWWSGHHTLCLLSDLLILHVYTFLHVCMLSFIIFPWNLFLPEAHWCDSGMV